MSIFANSFFSLAGQKERLLNVVETLKAAVTTGGIQAHTGSETVNKVLETAANHPFLTAGAAAVAINPAGAAAAAKAVTTKAATSFATAPLKTQVIVTGATIVGGSALLNSPSLTKSVINAPSSLSNFGGNIGKAIENPSLSSISTIAKENPILTAGTAAIGIATVAGGVGTVATVLNTRSVNKNTEAIVEPAPQFTTTTKYRDASGTLTSMSPDQAYKIAKEQLEIDKARQKADAELGQKTLEAQTKLAEMQLKNPSLIAAVPTPVKKAPAKKKAKKKPKKKAKKKPNKRKVYKRKTSKRKKR